MIKFEKEHLEHESNLNKFDTEDLKDFLKKVQIDFSSDSVYELKNIVQNVAKLNSFQTNSNETQEIKMIEPISDNLNNKPKLFNLEIAKLSGMWKGDADSKYWCPSGLVFNPSKNEIIVADSLNHELKIINAVNGDIKRSCNELKKNDSFTKLKTPRDVCMNTTGKLIISDSGNNRCCLVDCEVFSLITEFGGFGSDKGEFNDPRGVCLDTHDNIYVCDKGNHRIQIFDSSGNYLKELGSKGSSNGEFLYPEYASVSNNNHLLVSDTHNHRVQIFNVDFRDRASEVFCSFIACFGTCGNSPGSFRYPKGITTDSEGFIMVADWKNDRLQLFDPNGCFVTEISNSTKSLTRMKNFERPVGISILSNGGLAISTWGRTQNIQIV